MMTLEQQIQEDIKAAMKAHDAVAMAAVRAVKNKETAQVYVDNGRQELADNELAEAAVMERYLPKQLPPEELEAKVREIVAEVGATSIRDMGKVMGVASKRLAGVADGRAISAAVKALLG